MTIPGIKSIRGRLLVLVVLAVVPVFLLGLVIDIVAILREGRKERLAALANAPTHIASEIEHSWNSARSDALFLATIPPVDGIVRAWANNGLDPADGVSTEAFWRGRMAQIFAGLAATKGIYDQIRFLDHNGMEVVRVNFKDGKGIRVPDDQLQNKADRYYFTETAKLPQGQCYVSPADLNRERGQIEVPHKPMLRVATPVSDAAGQFRGMIVLNVLFGRLVEIAVAGHQIPSAETFIADESGYYIYHSASPRKLWGGPRDLGTGEGLQKDYPADWKTLLNAQSATLRTPHGYLLAEASRPWAETGRSLVVCALVPESLFVMHDVQQRVVWIVGGSLCLLVLVLIAVVWPLGRSIVRPVSSLLQAVTQFRNGDMGARALVVRRDEIGQLANAFNAMAETMTHEHERLEKQVQERTVNLEQSRRAALSLMQDATQQRKRAEDALQLLAATHQRLQIVLDSAGDGIYGIGEDGNGVLINRAALTMLGYDTPEEILGRNIHQLIHYSRHDGSPYPIAECPIYRALQGQPTSVVTTEVFWRKDGTAFPVEYRAHPMRDHERVIGCVVSFMDISERKRGEAVLAASKEAAEAANRAKSDFLASMSHELRTPLNAVIGFSEVLADRTFGDLNEKQDRYVGHILNAGRHLLSLINDILDLSKVEAGKMELDVAPVRVRTLLEDALTLVRERAMKHGLRLSTEGPQDLEVIADERKLKQILFNLLSNAIKFTPDGGSITVKAEVIADCGLRIAESEAGNPKSESDSPQWLRVSVSDTGVGIEPADMPRLFREFEQLDAGTDRKHQGTGLGLALCRRFVELHGGRIWVESEGAGKGSTFRFVIPAARPEPAARAVEKIEWTAEFSVGVGILDSQHQRLCGMLNTLLEARGAGAGKALVSRILDEMVQYAVEHFRDEERLMSQHGYPQMAEHVRQHQDFTEKTAELIAAARGGDQGVPEKLSGYLKRWLTHHILEVDAQYKPFFAEKGES